MLRALIFMVLLSGVAWGAQPELPITINVHPNSKYSTGVHEFGPVTIPLNAVAVEFTYDASDHTDPNICWTLKNEISFDSGSTWNDGGVAGRCGGTLFDGILITDSKFMFRLRDPTNANRRGKITLTVTGGTFQTSGSVTIR